MSLNKKLKAVGITLTDTKLGFYQTDCPRPYCQQDRAGRDTDCLNVEIIPPSFAKWKCTNCLWTDKIGEDPTATPQADEPAPPTVVGSMMKDGLPLEVANYFEDLGISTQVVKGNGIKWIADRNAIGFPYNHRGEPTNMLLISIPDGVKRLASSKLITLYGVEDANTEEALVIVSGEIERLMLQTSGVPNVIAIPNGGVVPARQSDSYEAEPDKFEYLAHAAEFLTKCKKIVIALDNTPAGDKLRHEITRRVGAAKCWNVKFTNKTLSSTFRERGIDCVCADIHEAVAHPIRGLYAVSEFENQLLTFFEGGMASGVSTGWDNIDELYTIVLGQLTVVTGIPNSGKSEWVDALTMNLALNNGWRFAVFSPENGKEVHVTKLVEKRVEITANPTSSWRMSRDTFLSGASWVGDHYFFIVSDLLDEMPTLEWILEKAAAAVLRYGIKGLIIDPWNRIEKKLGGTQNETDYVATCLAKILRFAANHDVHVWLVAHPSKQQADKKTGIIPPPSLYDIAGSAHFVNMADNGIVIHRSAGADNTTEVWVRKVRFKHVGTTGTAYLQYNKDTGRFAKAVDAAIYSQAKSGQGSLLETEEAA